jgi:aminopeptidase N
LDFLGSKEWGYEADKLKTTHPIAGDVANTEAALNIFDGITYAKGSACIQ